MASPMQLYIITFSPEFDWIDGVKKNTVESTTTKKKQMKYRRVQKRLIFLSKLKAKKHMQNFDFSLCSLVCFYFVDVIVLVRVTILSNRVKKRKIPMERTKRKIINKSKWEKKETKILCHINQWAMFVVFDSDDDTDFELIFFCSRSPFLSFSFDVVDLNLMGDLSFKLSNSSSEPKSSQITCDWLSGASQWTALHTI